VHGSRTCVFFGSVAQARVGLKPSFGTYGIAVIGRYLILFLHALMSCGAPNMHRRSSKAFEQHQTCTGVAPKCLTAPNMHRRSSNMFKRRFGLVATIGNLVSALSP
jgi:hypothetical protein